MTDTTPQKIYLDTFVFMDILSDDKESAAKAEAYLARLKSASGVISSVMLAELAYHIKRKRGKETAEEILMFIASLPNLEIAGVTPEISKAAGLMRARYHDKIQKKLTYFDCIHLCTALAANCDVFVTGDRGFKDIREIKVEIY